MDNLSRLTKQSFFNVRIFIFGIVYVCVHNGLNYYQLNNNNKKYILAIVFQNIVYLVAVCMYSNVYQRVSGCRMEPFEKKKKEVIGSNI